MKPLKIAILWTTAAIRFLILVEGNNVSLENNFQTHARGIKGGGHDMFWVAEKDSGGGDLLHLCLLLLLPLLFGILLIPSGLSLMTSMMAMMQAMNGNGNGAATNGNGGRRKRSEITEILNIRPEIENEILRIWNEAELAFSKNKEFW